jgi:hypothetical protein
MELLSELAGMVETWRETGMPLADVQTRFNKQNWGNITGGILQVNGFEDFYANAQAAAEELDDTRREFADLVDKMSDPPQGFWTATELTALCTTESLLKEDLGGGKDRSRCTRMGRIAGLAAQTALLVPKSPILLLSPTLRQSGELFRKVIDLYMALNAPIKILSQTTLKMELANGSRIVSLPGTEGTIRGFSGVSLLVIDEAARVADPLYFSVRPMLAVSQGRMIALSTPFGQRGWFYDVWIKDPDWNKVKISAHECPRITKEFLESERRALGERWYRQEYLNSYEDTIDAVFSSEDIQAALSDDVKPLFG